MQLNFTGHDGSRTEELAPEVLLRRFHRDTAHFHHNGNWNENGDVVTVTFNPMIYVNQDLQGQPLADAMQHEERHLADFRRRVGPLRSDLRAIVARRQYTTDYMRDRWAWFLYDLCVDSHAFHQSIGAMVERCWTPDNPRP